MKIEIQHNMADVGRFVSFVFADQVPYVTARALNDAAVAAQKAQRDHQRKVFTVRRRSFVDRAVKIKPFADHKVGRFQVRIFVDPPGGQGRATVLTQHETDTRKTPYRGRTVAVPTEHVRRHASGIIRKVDRPSSLLARERSGKAFRGDRRGIFRKDDTIFERRRDGEIRALYQLVHSVPLDQRLEFVENVSRTALATYPRAFVTRFDRAVRTAR